MHSPQLFSVPIAAPSLIKTGRRTASIRIECEEDKRKRQTRLQEKDTTERMRKAAEEMERHRFEEAERKNEDKVVGNDKERRRLVERLKETDSPSPPLSALTMARNIDRLDEIEYPQGIKSPKTELTQNAKDGKFR